MTLRNREDDVMGLQWVPCCCVVATVLLAAPAAAAPTQEGSSEISCFIPAGNADTGRVIGMGDVPGVGMLIHAEKGWFLARRVNGALAVEPAGNADTGGVFEMRDVPGVGVLVRAEKGRFLAAPTPGVGASGKVGVQPHALAYAPGVAMPRQIEAERATVPSAGSAGGPP
jgi:hypothetical protein